MIQYYIRLGLILFLGPKLLTCELTRLISPFLLFHQHIFGRGYFSVNFQTTKQLQQKIFRNFIFGCPITWIVNLIFQKEYETELMTIETSPN